MHMVSPDFTGRPPLPRFGLWHPLDVHRVAPTARHGGMSTKQHDFAVTTTQGSRPMSGPESFGPAGSSASEIPPLVVNPAGVVASDATVLAHPASRDSSLAEVTLGAETMPETMPETLRPPMPAPREEETDTVSTAEETEV